VIKSRRSGWVTYVALAVGEVRGIQCFSGKALGKEPLGRPRRRWEGNIKMGLQVIGTRGELL